MKTEKPSRRARASRGPFPHPFDVRSLKASPREVSFAATPEQRAAVAEAVDLPEVASIDAFFRLVARAGDRVDLAGRVRARVSQSCVVTLEPFETLVDQAVSLTFAPEVPASVEFRGVRYDTEAPVAAVGGNDDQPDPPDPIVDDTIDLGAVAVEFLVLGLDPYPRKPGVHFDDMVVEHNDAPSAFAALTRLKDRS